MLSIWDLYAWVYDFLPKYFKPYKELVEEVVSEVKKCLPRGVVLDVGCGTGNYSIALAKNGYDVTGIDYSASMLRRARKKGNVNQGKPQFVQTNLKEKLPYNEEHFDCVISIHSLYTIKETDRVLKEYYRVLRPYGRFVLSEPRYPVKLISCLKGVKKGNGLKGAIIVFCSLFSSGIINLIIARRQATGYYYYWNEQEITDKLSEAGFKLISIKKTYVGNSDLMVISSKM